MREPEKVILANMCMVYDDKGRVLAENRVDPHWPGVVFPGGHVEPGESCTDAVIREVWEETGLCISHPRLCGVKQWREGEIRHVVLLYKTDRFEGTLVSSPEGEVFWTDLKRFLTLPLAKSMDEMLRVFLEEDMSELFYVEPDKVWTLK